MVEQRRCPSCSGPLERDAARCPWCGATRPVSGLPLPPPPPLPPAAASWSQASTSAPVWEAPPAYASVVQRIGAWLFDLVVITVGTVLIGCALLALYASLPAGGMADAVGYALILGSGLPGFFIYPIAMEAIRGQTLGKQVAGIRVVRSDGSPADLLAALLRGVLRMVDGLFFGLLGVVIIAASDRHQRLGDMVAGTIVVRDRR